MGANGIRGKSAFFLLTGLWVFIPEAMLCWQWPRSQRAGSWSCSPHPQYHHASSTQLCMACLLLHCWEFPPTAKAGGLRSGLGVLHCAPCTQPSPAEQHCCICVARAGGVRCLSDVPSARCWRYRAEQHRHFGAVPSAPPGAIAEPRASRPTRHVRPSRRSPLMNINTLICISPPRAAIGCPSRRSSPAPLLPSPPPLPSPPSQPNLAAASRPASPRSSRALIGGRRCPSAGGVAAAAGCAARQSPAGVRRRQLLLPPRAALRDR